MKECGQPCPSSTAGAGNIYCEQRAERDRYWTCPGRQMPRPPGCDPPPIRVRGCSSGRRSHVRGFRRRRGSEGKQVLWEAAAAKRQREMDSWEARCRAALQLVHEERVEAMGKGAVDTLQCRLNITVLQQHQWSWDRGWLEHWAQEEAAKLWVWDGGPGADNRLLPHPGARTQWFTHMSSRRGPKS